MGNVPIEAHVKSISWKDHVPYMLALPVVEISLRQDRGPEPAEGAGKDVEGQV